ncbi:MAG: cohesin domain-containing protein [Candidatus Zhuqueibacterota bacterium]
MRNTSILCLGILLFFSVAALQASVEVTLPDTSYFPGDTLRVPVRVSDLTGLEIYSYQFMLHYDPAVVQMLGVDSTGSLTQAWGSAVMNLSSPGTVTLGNYGTSVLSGAGVLMYLEFALIGQSDDSTQLDVQNFEFNDANPAAVVTDGSIKILYEPVVVTFNVNIPENMEFFIDGVRHNFPFETEWGAGSVHTISTTSPQQISANTRAVFERWSDGGAMSHTVSVTENTQFTLYMDKQYLLAVSSQYGVIQGQGWYSAGESATFSVDSVVVQDNGTRQRFTGWNGVGTGSYTGAERTNTIVITAPVTETATWKTQYFVSVKSAHGTPVGEGWYDGGTSASISIDSLVSGAPGTRYLFESWTGSGAGSYSGKDRLAQFTVSGPIIEKAFWQTQFHFSLNSDPADLVIFKNAGWYNKNTVVKGDVAPEFAGTADTTYRFQTWTLDGQAVSVNPVETMMDTSHVAVAAYGIDSVRVKIVTEVADDIVISLDGVSEPLPYEAFWRYQSDHVVSVAEVQFASDSTARYAFASWSNGGAREQTLRATAAQVLELNVTTEFHLAVGTNPAGLIEFQESGWYLPGASVAVQPAPPVVVAGQDTFFFKGWQIDGAPREGNPVSVLMDEPHEVVAIYANVYSIIGMVRNTRQTSLNGAVVILSGDKTDTLVTDDSGEFFFSDLAPGDYRVTPRLEGFSFEPEFREYTSLNQMQLHQDFLGTDIQMPVVALLAPTGGEQFQGATEDTIHWSVSDNGGIDSVFIEFSSNNGGLWQLLAAFNGATVETIAWSIPDINSTTCKIRVRAIDFDGNVAVDACDSPFTIIGNSGIQADPEPQIPGEFHVAQNYPNPFNSATVIPIQLPEKSLVAIRIYNLVGQEICLLLNQELPAGHHRIHWEAKNTSLAEMGSGIYFYRVEAMGRVFTGRLVYLR